MWVCAFCACACMSQGSGAQINPLPVSCHLILAPTTHVDIQCCPCVCVCVCVCVCQSDHRPHPLANGSHWRRQKDLQATGLIDTSHFRCLCSGRKYGSEGDKRECKKRAKKWRTREMEWKDEEERAGRGKGDSAGGRKNCWERVGQLIFYKPGLERSWNEEWERDSWESATGRRRGEEWDSWITRLWSETSVGFAVEREKQRVVGERWLHPASSVCLDRFRSDFLSLCRFFFCLVQLEITPKGSYLCFLDFNFNFKSHAFSNFVPSGLQKNRFRCKVSRTQYALGSTALLY